ncbi:IucA/IucC family C-terminal-domain containing protein [Bacillus salacetis]|uniref:IucA/IucC family C-terminal-domain containing protein n=1 Tax=Bacillus salacetis TaxID=2315464 RepID=UPI003B9F0B04
MIRATLSEQEEKQLGVFRFFSERPGDRELTPAKQLIDSDGLAQFLHEYTDQIGTDDKIAQSSLLVKRYAFLAVISLCTFSVFNKKLNVSPDNIFLANGEKNGLWMPGFYFEDPAAEDVNDREAAREEVAAEVFRNHLFPLINAVKQVSNLSHLISWENIAVYIFWVYEGLVEQEEFQHARGRMEEDFQWLLQDRNAWLFGPYQRNPLARFYRDKQYVAEQGSELRVRKTCCFSYKLRGGERNRCTTCPQTCNVKQPKGVR